MNRIVTLILPMMLLLSPSLSPLAQPPAAEETIAIHQPDSSTEYIEPQSDQIDSEEQSTASLIVYLPMVFNSDASSGISSPEAALEELDEYQETPQIAGTTYYVANDGDDGHNGTSADTPWKTIAHVNGQTFSPGDGVLFKRGDEWREMLMINASGTESAPITYAAYGEGKAPAILGSTAITTWENVTGNVWKGSTAVDDPSRGALHDGSEKGSGGWPGGAWFVAHDGTVVWGNQEKYLSSGLQVLEKLYDWGWDNGYIYIYSEGNPALHWSALEVSQRSSSIEMPSGDAQDWIVIDNIQMLFTQAKGFFSGYPAMEAEGLTIKNCRVGWVGIQGGAAADGLKVWHSRSIYKDNVIHDCGRHGIGVLPFGGNVDMVSDLYIDNNTFYNGFHTTGIDIQLCEANGMSDFTIINNQFLGSPNYDLGADEAFNSNHIWIGSNAGAFKNFNFINNIFTHIHGKGLTINEIDGTTVYHNTFYGVNPTLANGQGQLYYIGSIKNSIVRNNIFYNNMDTSFNNGVYSVKINDYQMSEIDMDYNLHYASDPNAPLIKIIEISGSYQMVEWNNYTTETGWDKASPAPQDPQFVAVNNYHLQSGSPAEAKGIYIATASQDRDGKLRSNPPSIGVYE